MKILAIISGEYGERHVENLSARGPEGWEIHIWRAPPVLPPVIDDPLDFLPGTFPRVELILSFADQKGVAELLPDIASMTQAKAVIAAIDNEAWLPRGLARQLQDWLAAVGVACATPKPLCSLTESDYAIALRERIAYESPIISAFARHFGRPILRLTIDHQSRTIASAEVERDAVCGCARHVAENLVGVSVDEAEEKAGLLHHHYPCMASMQKLPDFNNDTLMHASGNLLKDNVAMQAKPFRDVRYLRPGTRSES
jgi:hypothetical protein